LQISDAVCVVPADIAVGEGVIGAWHRHLVRHAGYGNSSSGRSERTRRRLISSACHKYGAEPSSVFVPILNFSFPSRYLSQAGPEPSIFPAVLFIAFISLISYKWSCAEEKFQ
jgi:hypothetical protein